MKLEPGRQRRVRELARRVRERFSGAFEIPAGDSPIVPLIVGESETANSLARELENQGMITWPIRPPTVARGRSRVRITLSCEHSDDEVARLCDALLRVQKSP